MPIRSLFMAATLIFVVLASAVAAVTQPFVTPVPSTPPRVDPARLEAHVKFLSVDCYPRSFDQPRKIEMAARYVFDELRAMGASVSIQDVSVGETTYKNIIARFGPESGPLLVVGAHYDSNGDVGAKTGDSRGFTRETHTPGADDNASGVAGLIELARLLGSKQQTRPIELVAYTLEEPPHFRTEHMGSAWHARSLKTAKRDVQLMLSLEMIGYFSDEPDSQGYPVPGMAALYPDRGNYVALVGKMNNLGATRKVKALLAGATDLPIYSINAPEMVPGIDFSDHQSYWNEGFPALMITDTAFFRNQNYHKAGDTHEKLDFTRMTKVVESVHAVTQQY
jgi:Zn-dependent M28 family amino/carboxypeptidase